MLRYVFFVMAIASAVAFARSLTAQEIARFLDYHNRARDNVTKDFPDVAPARCIPHVVWDDWLAWHAQNYSDSCPAGHSYHAYQDGSAMGENLAWTTSDNDPIDFANMAWYEEWHDYHFEVVGGTSAKVGHYTQMVWEGTLYIGCGWRDDCTSGMFTRKHNAIACNYWPAGNYVGRHPWTQRSSGDPLPTCPEAESSSSGGPPQCTSGFCCDLRTHTFRSNTFKCRTKQCDCDAIEYCTGNSSDCPADQFLSSDCCDPETHNYRPSDFECRPKNGDCDAAEYCTGKSPDCPKDSYASRDTVCNASSAPCEADAFCTGSSVVCPPKELRDSNYVCRPAAGKCDVEEKCNGTSLYCPEDKYLPSGTSCNDGDTCPGDSPFCPGENVSLAPKSCGSWICALLISLLALLLS